ncbi:MAG: hypothetical protein DMF14_04185 [Verrucomicrobia bacterium]|nr:MAG: hypothetical protein DMF14_04185 [Verrucomicrobiota bacterium]TMP90477.1 MAG: hypothetical protein E6L06_07235 [Verrucomicrobiota bacterium]
MLGSIMLGRLRKTLLLTATGAVFCLSGNSIAAAPFSVQVPNPSTSPSSPRFVVLTQPVKVKIAYGETVLPAGMKLPVVSSDATSVRVNYMGELQTIPIGAARFEGSAAELPDAASEIPPIVPSKPAAVPSTTPGTQLQVSLQPGYDSRMQGGDISMREMQLLLSSHCSEGVDLSGAGTKIYNGVTYLMDSEQAATVLGLAHSVPSRVPVAAPGFPKNSTYYIGYDGAFEGHFNRLYLVTDTANKVVAIQLVDEHPKGRWKSAAALAAATWSTYNFINARMRASDTVRVQAVSKRQGNIILIDTQVYQRVRTRAGRKNVDRYEEQENAKLFIPIPFARIILHCAKIGLAKT